MSCSFFLSKECLPGCRVRMHGLHPWSSKGSALGFAAGLAVTCSTDAGKPLDSQPTVEIKCPWRVISRFTVATGRWDVLVKSEK